MLMVAVAERDNAIEMQMVFTRFVSSACFSVPQRGRERKFGPRPWLGVGACGSGSALITNGDASIRKDTEDNSSGSLFCVGL
jgi:hypothetical protein